MIAVHGVAAMSAAKIIPDPQNSGFQAWSRFKHGIMCVSMTTPRMLEREENKPTIFELYSNYILEAATAGGESHLAAPPKRNGI